MNYIETMHHKSLLVGLNPSKSQNNTESQGITTAMQIWSFQQLSMYTDSYQTY